MTTHCQLLHTRQTQLETLRDMDMDLDQSAPSSPTAGSAECSVRIDHYGRNEDGLIDQVEPPHSVTSKRCDGCKRMFFDMAFMDLPPERYTFPCYHVYCGECFETFTKMARNGQESKCRVEGCDSCLVRGLQNPPYCGHQVPVRNYSQRDYRYSMRAMINPDFMLRSRQRVGQKCQRCALIKKLKDMTRTFQKEILLAPYNEEVFAYVNANGYRLHGMLHEPQDATIDLEVDVAMPRPAAYLKAMAKEAMVYMHQFPLEPGFDPRGEWEFRICARRFKLWLNKQVYADMTPVNPPPVQNPRPPCIHQHPHCNHRHQPCNHRHSPCIHRPLVPPSYDRAILGAQTPFWTVPYIPRTLNDPMPEGAEKVYLDYNKATGKLKPRKLYGTPTPPPPPAPPAPPPAPAPTMEQQNPHKRPREQDDDGRQEASERARGKRPVRPYSLGGSPYIIL